jgi:HAD superfamily hydrolase (TIGR01509 family)
MHSLRGTDASSTTTVLLDADGTLFPSEEPAFVASATVTQHFAERYGLTGDFSADHLRRSTTGKNFRTTAQELLAQAGVGAEAEEFSTWVEREKREVTAYLAQVLRPHADVLAALTAMRRRYRLAVVSSSALARLAACFTASGLDEILPPSVRFSAEDSLPVPTSKPHPAVYEFAARRLGASPDRTLAVEDSVTGAESALAAGIPTVGLVQFVPPDERAQRADQLHRTGVSAVLSSWTELDRHLLGRSVPSPA